MVIALATLAALLNAIASILQRLGVETAPHDAGMSTRLVTHMLSRRVWIAGFAVMGGAFAAQAFALYRGSLVVVQPILVSELVFIVAALGVWYSMAVGAREVIASIMAAGGLAAFLVVANPLSGTNSPGNRAWIVAMVVLIVPAAALVVSARRGPRWWRALALGAAASIGFAITAALTKATTDALAAGVTTMLESWETYALVVLGLTSFLLMQSAFHAGPFAASQVTLILVNPLVSIGLGVALFADHVNSSAAAITAQVFALTIMVGGAVILATSSLIAGVHSEDPTSHLLAGRGRLAKYLLHREQTRRGAAP